jgi:hypothetical protein
MAPREGGGAEPAESHHNSGLYGPNAVFLSAVSAFSAVLMLGPLRGARLSPPRRTRAHSPCRGPKIAVPMRTMLAPSSTATP